MKELLAVEPRFVDNHLDALGLDPFHDSLDRALAEVVAALFHHQAVDANNAKFDLRIDRLVVDQKEVLEIGVKAIRFAPNFVDAHLEVARYYALGLGMSRDLDRATRHYELAVDAGLETAALKFARAIDSSVDSVREITDLIQAQRGYELNAKVISAVDQMLGATTQIR